MSLRVLHPGMALLVDAGRPQSRRFGMPVGGPADRASCALANVLLGNPVDALALEITLVGPLLRAEATVGLAVVGAPFQVSIDDAKLPLNGSFTLHKGQLLRVGGTAIGCRAYLAVRGGFQSPCILGSYSALQSLAVNEELYCEPSTAIRRVLSFEHTPLAIMAEPVPLRYLAGPQADWFATTLAGHEYRVGSQSNRMGVRLHGPIVQRSPREMISEAVAPGAIQITNEGQPIILGVDGQTIGGYPKIAHVIDADMDRVGQLRPGMRVCFHPVNEDEAQKLSQQQRSDGARYIRYLHWALL